MPSPITIFIADCCPYLSTGLANQLQAEGPIYVAATATSWPQLINLLHQKQPDALLLSHQFTGHHPGEPAWPLLLRQLPQLPLVLLLPGAASPRLWQTATADGVLGFTCPQCRPAQMANVVLQAARGSLAICTHHTPAARQSFGNRWQPPAISERELALLALLVAGKNNEQIAKELYLSVRNTTRLLKELKDKCGVSSRQSLVAYAVAHGLARLPGHAQPHTTTGL
jgi:DNA-binding NarL/FixJ family response regulator